MTGPCRACIDEGRDGCFVCQPEPAWCHHCNGYGSSLQEEGDRCSHCGGSGLARAVAEANAISRAGVVVKL